MNFTINTSLDSHSKRIRFSGSPLAFILILFALLILFLFFWTAVQLLYDSYFPYQGEVLKIEERWYDILVSEFSMLEHLTIRTIDGKIIDRYTFFERRIINGIKVGSHVTKKAGFGNHPTRMAPH